MALPIGYNIRSVLIRWRSTLSTILGIALVVAVFVLVQSLAAGLKKSAGNTGDPRNMLILRKGATSESSSQVNLEQYKLLQYLPSIEKDASKAAIISADVLVLINLPRKAPAKGEANLLVRGVSPKGLELRPQVKIVDGRWFERGKREVVVSRKLAARFQNLAIGEKFKTGGTWLTVVGWTDGARSAFDSELWMDADDARSVFDRQYFSSVVARVAGKAEGEALVKQLEADKRLPLRAESEVAYYAAQTNTATPIKILGNFLAIMMSIGAVFSAMNTMYASVGARTREVGTLRVLGFHRRYILVGFLLEGAFLALLGGIVGCALSMPMNGYATGTFSFENFSEVVFEFRITPELVMQGLVFSVVVGILGSLLPAIRAARLPVIASLKSL